MKDSQYLVRPTGQPALTCDSIGEAAHVLLAAGSTEPVSVVTHGSAGQRERDLTSAELRRLGLAIRSARERGSEASTGGLARLVEAIVDLAPSGREATSQEAS